MERPERPSFPRIGSPRATAPHGLRSKLGSSAKTGTPVPCFHAAAQSYLEGWAELFPHEASDLGLHQFDTLLGGNQPKTHRLHVSLLAKTLHEVEALPEAAFRGDDWLDRRGLLALLRTRL